MRHAVILAGGGGTRLWPASRKAKPKQFLRLGAGDESLLSATARRLRDACEDRLYVVTAADQVSLVRDAVPALPEAQVIAEPSARNTAAALGLAAIELLHRDPQAIMAALPSDQHIADEVEFSRVVQAAFMAAETHDAIITVGIVPTRAETGYGYLKLGNTIEGEIREVAAFVEKPDTATAHTYVRSGDYLWNGGMFFCKAQRLVDEINRCMPETGEGLAQIAAALGTDAAVATCESIYPTLPSISIDYGVMEQTKPVLTIGGDFGWNDVGSWSALSDYLSPDEDGNIKLGSSVTLDARNNIIVADEGHIVAAAGVENMVIVQSDNAVLVLPRERVQDVRALVDAIGKGDSKQFL